jgi:AraC family transcriptional activator of pobA
VRLDIPVYDISNFKEYKNQGILASRFGHYFASHTHLHKVHRHSFYHLVYFSRGSGHQHIDFKQFPVKPGTIYFMIPGQVHSWEFEEEPDGYIINFSTAYFHEFLSKTSYLEQFSIFSGITDQQVVILQEEVAEQLSELFEGILKEGFIKQTFSNDMVRALLLQIFIKVERLTNRKIDVYGSSYNHTIFRNFQQLIVLNYKQLKLPKEYAELLYITPNHLNALCKDIIGMSAGEVIREHIILEAKRLLINQHLSISEISHQLNYSDQSYFTKLFKKHEGLTPERFRKHNIQQDGK